MYPHLKGIVCHSLHKCITCDQWVCQKTLGVTVSQSLSTQLPRSLKVFYSLNCVLGEGNSLLEEALYLYRSHTSTGSDRWFFFSSPWSVMCLLIFQEWEFSHWSHVMLTLQAISLGDQALTSVAKVTLDVTWRWPEEEAVPVCISATSSNLPLRATLAIQIGYESDQSFCT